ncbi:MAG: sigma-54 dependent transcriptional regulator [Chlamydiales bacterium]|nr:sigma-54 dependent transcriptional regulator [Chlamydiales bacterium]
MEIEVYIIGDDKHLQQELTDMLANTLFKVSCFSFDAFQENIANKSPPDIAILLVNQASSDKVPYLEKNAPGLPFIVVSKKEGSTAFLEENPSLVSRFMLYPFDNKSLEYLINEQVKHSVKKELTKEHKHSLVFAKGSKMEKVFEDLKVIAKSNALTVFIHGETGTGKEVIAREIHNFSKRVKNPFVEINVTALPPELLESELFGHEAGAFTGAKEVKKGLFEVADKGTLFLDEIGDMDLSMQAKILRALQERKIRRVGGTKQIPVDIRLITATNKNLVKEVQAGYFRRDLFYRLNVVSLYLPPLRERGKDLEALAHHFIKHFNKQFGRHVKKISPEALETLRGYSWPGNIRELKNMLEHTLLLECNGEELGAQDLKFSTTAHYGEYGDNLSKVLQDDKLKVVKAQENPQEPKAMWEVEKEHIKKVLSFTKNNKNKAAKILQIDRTTLYNKMRKYEIQS